MLVPIWDGDYPQSYNIDTSLTYYWDVATLSWVKGTQPGGGVGGSGLTDAELRATPVAVSGTFFQATQPISAAALPLPAGAATAALQLPDGHNVTVDNAAGAAAVNIQDGGNSITVDGTFWQATQPVSGTVTANQGGIWTVQPGNTANTTPWLVTPRAADLTPSSPTAATVGVASAQVVPANASRKGLAVINVSNNRISLGLGAAAVLDSGITLYPGGSFEMDEYSFDAGAVNAIASAASSPLAIQEWT